MLKYLIQNWGWVAISASLAGAVAVLQIEVSQLKSQLAVQQGVSRSEFEAYDRYAAGAVNRLTTYIFGAKAVQENPIPKAANIPGAQLSAEIYRFAAIENQVNIAMAKGQAQLNAATKAELKSLPMGVFGTPAPFPTSSPHE